MSQFFAPGGQNIGTLASPSVLPMNIQGFPLGLTGLISLEPRDSQESSPTPQFESINSLALSLLYSPLSIPWASLQAQLVKNLPATQETWVQSLGREDCLEKEMATHSSILAWRIPTDGGA